MSLTQLRLDEMALTRLDAIAASQDCSREDLLRQVVMDYLELKELEADIEKGRADVARGATYSAEEVERYFSHMRESLRARVSR